MAALSLELDTLPIQTMCVPIWKWFLVASWVGCFTDPTSPVSSYRKRIKLLARLCACARII